MMGALATPITGILIDRIGKRPLVSIYCFNLSLPIQLVYDNSICYSHIDASK